MDGPEQERRLTIDELARETGMTARNIRAHQSRGLLRPPEVRARTGYYDGEHVRRIRAIQEMQSQGFNLEAIKHLLDLRSGTGDQAVAFQRAVLTPFFSEAPEVIDRAELGGVLGTEVSADQLAELERAEMLRELGPDTWEVASPTMLRAGGELVDMGIPLDQVIAAGVTIRENTRAIATEFVSLYVTEVLEPLRENGRLGESELALASEAVERLRPLASEAVLAGFGRMMSAAVEQELRRASGEA